MLCCYKRMFPLVVSIRARESYRRDVRGVGNVESASRRLSPPANGRIGAYRGIDAPETGRAHIVTFHSLLAPHATVPRRRRTALGEIRGDSVSFSFRCDGF